MSYLWLLRETHIFAVLKLLNRLCQEKEKWASRSWSFWIRLGNPQTNVSVFVQSFSYKYDPNDALLIVFFCFYRFVKSFEELPVIIFTIFILNFLPW